MAELAEVDDHHFEDMTTESPDTIGRNDIRRLGLTSHQISQQ